MTKQLLLLPHQFALIKDEETKILGLVSGFGARENICGCS